MKPGVSVIVCAYNAATRIEETIRHLAYQRVPDAIAWEVILIDNQSIDNTAAIATLVWKNSGSKKSLKIVQEAQQGLSYARATGFAEAQYEFVLMCDDDNWLEPDYVATVFSLMTQYPNIGALGGLGEITFEIPPPDWVPAISVYATGEQNATSGKVESNFLYGAGCVVRQSALMDLYNRGYKQLLKDREGVALTSGGDYELCYALSIIGYDIWYDERLKFKHFVTGNRLTWQYVKRYVNESSRCFEILTSYKYIAKYKRSLSLPLVMLISGQYSFRMLIRSLLLRVWFPHTDTRWKKAYIDFIFYRNILISLITGIKNRKRAHQQVLKLFTSS